jgi:hypothetical protein
MKAGIDKIDLLTKLEPQAQSFEIKYQRKINLSDSVISNHHRRHAPFKAKSKQHTPILPPKEKL